ncbi:uncharacterized protein LOC106151587 [Lingula anatina]|uniref:Uncharacterized protein LOC106151587 n=1 Tax=Lingula anatina TaxID=7574 RepID=A0A1S3H352_LINAN|nr:uncharacterized protein LOC106151587 [Lingula anatina]|eukprot:XP_013380377.1 uncharacterized protein LOC106151587 [Lingula anatina]
MKCVGPPGGDPCGADLDPGNKFCPNCGTSVKLSTIVECESRTVCTNIIDGRECGATLLPTHNFCPSCGDKKNPGNFRVEQVQGAEINQLTVEGANMPKRTSDSETPSLPKKIKVDEELCVDMSQVKYPPSMQTKDEKMAEEQHHQLRPGCSANDSSQVSGISSGSSQAPVTSSDSRQAPGTPSGSSQTTDKSSGSPQTTGTPSGASQAPGTSSDSSQATGIPSGSSQATGTPSSSSQEPGTSSGSSQEPGTTSGSLQATGTPSGSSKEPGTSSSSSQATVIPSGSSQATGTPSSSSQEPGTSSGSSQEPGTTSGSSQATGTPSGSSQEPGTSSGLSQAKGTDGATEQIPSTGHCPIQTSSTVSDPAKKSDTKQSCGEDAHEDTPGDEKRVTSNMNTSSNAATNAGIFSISHSATSSTADKEGKVFGEGNKGDISAGKDKKANNTTDQPPTSSLPEKNEDVGSPVDGPQSQKKHIGSDTREMSTTAKIDNRTGSGEIKVINKKKQEAEEYVPGKKATTKKGQNKSTNVSAQRSVNSNEEVINVHFHVIMPPDVSFDHQKDTFVMKFGLQELRGFQSKTDDWVLQRERDLPDDMTMYHVEVPIKIVNLRGNKFVVYKYVIHRRESEKFQWEDNFGYGFGDAKDRVLAVPDRSLIAKGSWDQYDGMVFFGKDTFTSEKTTFLKSIRSGLKYLFGRKNLSDTPHGRFLMTSKTAFSHMMPSWEGFVVDGSGSKGFAHEVVDNACQVIHSLRHRFIKPDGHSVDYSLLRQAFWEYVQPRLDKCKYENTINETVEEGELRVASVAAILCIMDYFSMPLDETGDRAESVASSLFEGLLLPGKNDKCETFQKLVEVHFPQKEHQMKIIRALSGLFQQCAGGQKNDHKWLLAVPLYHFLCGHSKPFSNINIAEKHNDPSGKWWGIEDIKSAVDRFKKKMEPVQQLIDRLAPLFEMDKLLPRTLMSTISFRNLKEVICSKTIPPEVSTAALYFYIHELKYLSTCKTDFRALISALDAIKEVIESRLTVPSLGSDWQYGNIKEISMVALDLLEQCTDRMDKDFWGFVCSAVDVFSTASRVQHTALVKSYGGAGKETEFQEESDVLAAMFSSTLDHVWTRLLSLEWPKDETAKEWQKRLRQALKGRIDSIYTVKTKIELFCSTNPKEYHHIVEECLSQAAFEAIDAVESSGTRQRTAILSDDCQIRLTEVSSLLHKTVKDVENGTVQIRMLELVLKNRDSFLGLCRTIEDVEKEALKEGQHQKSSESGQSEMKQSKVDQLDIILQHRLKEMEAFESIKQFLGIFTGLCKIIQPVNTDALDRRLRQDISCRDLSDICEPYIMHPDVTQNWQPAITFFEPPSEVFDMMMPLTEIHSSHIFVCFWKEFGSIAHKEKLEDTDGETDVLSLQEVATEVWGKAFHSWENLAKSIKRGTVTFGQMDEYLASFKDRYPELKVEFDLMGNILKDASWIPHRLDQVKQYHKLHEYRYGAQVMMDAKKELGLTGDFSLIEILVDAGAGKENQLSSINSKVVDAGKVLIRVDKTKSDCIKDFVKCRPLVNWLRENIKGTKELNVLVELAMIQAGETDMEVDRVSILHDAAIGFAPLIYEVQADCDFHQFLHQCELVWNALDNDKHLPVKLRDTMRHLDWVKMIKDSHGSVEVSSLAQAEAINSRGIYQVGNLRPDQPKTMENTIKLVVPPDPRAYGKRSEEDVDFQDDRPVEYTFEKLNDLQSKLMLVAGKVGKVDHSKAEVDKFVEVFDAIGRLAKAYLKICAAGSVLFNDWTSKFFCDLTKPWSTIISFGLAEQELRGKPDRLQEEGLSTQIRELCEFMENCYEDWLKYIEKQRCSYYELNFFSTEQLVILRREISKLGLEGSIKGDEDSCSGSPRNGETEKHRGAERC